MRSIDPAIQTALDGGATTLCRCWRVTRRDGVVLGFTDHDADLAFEGCAFRATTGLDAAALQTATGLSVDTSQAVGALTDDAISEKDIRAGRFDHASIDHWLVDWRNPALRIHLFSGRIGEIRRAGGAFEAELRGLADALNVPVGRTLLRTCDRVVGDEKCGVDLSAPSFFLETEVVGPVMPGHILGQAAGQFADGWFEGGLLRWMTGENAGLSTIVRRDSVEGARRRLVPAEEPALPVRAGDRLKVTAGCDRRAETCAGKFANFRNFRGFPHIPGEDWIFAYPKSGDTHDGSSRGRS